MDSEQEWRLPNVLPSLHFSKTLASPFCGTALHVLLVWPLDFLSLLPIAVQSPLLHYKLFLCPQHAQHVPQVAVDCVILLSFSSAF